MKVKISLLWFCLVTVICRAGLQVLISPTGTCGIQISPWPTNLTYWIKQSAPFQTMIGAVANGGCTGNWRLYLCDDSTLNPSCWVTNTNWRCLIFGKGQSSPPATNSWIGICSMTLITSRHAITTEHTGGLSANATPVWMLGNDGNWYSNYIASGTQLGGTDIQLVTFSNNWPSVIQPAMMFPTNIPPYFDYNFVGVPILEFNNNTRLVNGMICTGTYSDSAVGLQIGAQVGLANCPFNDGSVSGGASSSPLFIPMGTNLVMVCSYGISGDISGPCLFDTNNMSLILAAIGTNQVTYPNLANFSQIP